MKEEAHQKRTNVQKGRAWRWALKGEFHIPTGGAADGKALPAEETVCEARGRQWAGAGACNKRTTSSVGCPSGPRPEAGQFSSSPDVPGAFRGAVPSLER